MRIAFTGGRHYENYTAIRRVAGALNREATLLVGDATGLDYNLAKIAKSQGLNVVVFNAEWDRLGRAAGPIRNKQMLQDADLLIAFPGGRGTADCTSQAHRLGIPVMYVEE